VTDLVTIAGNLDTSAGIVLSPAVEAEAEEGAAVSEGRAGRLSATTAKKKDICLESVPKAVAVGADAHTAAAVAETATTARSPDTWPAIAPTAVDAAGVADMVAVDTVVVDVAAVEAAAAVPNVTDVKGMVTWPVIVPNERRLRDFFCGPEFLLADFYLNSLFGNYFRF